ncbi:hypothetical protein [Micromonospora sp. NPDC005203]|uniref:hypothetical protein n=1 Tax=Micromonospora sp. NPDC005203 TaxID=3364226 RepID=UPI003678B28D
MAFMTELMVNEYGYLLGGERSFPVDVVEHDWLKPYPQFEATVSFRWEAGDLLRRPNIFRHPEIRDWVCDDAAYSVLSGLAPHDLRVIGRGWLGDTPMHIVQVVSMLDIVDLDSSVIQDYGSYQVVDFPAFRRSADLDIGSRIFRVPGSYTGLFIGDTIRDSLDGAKISGLGYVPVPFVD